MVLLTVKNKLSFIFYAFICIPFISFLSCSHGIKYTIDRVDPSKINLIKSFSHRNYTYSFMITKKLWRDAIYHRFIEERNLGNFYDPYMHNSMNEGLGEIFFQTLRFSLNDSSVMGDNSSIKIQEELEDNKHQAKMELEPMIRAYRQSPTENLKMQIRDTKNRYNAAHKRIIERLNRLELVSWDNMAINRPRGLNTNSRAYKNFICPRPWKYKKLTINGLKCGVFYLDCVQMGEYFDPLGHRRHITNMQRIGDGRSPYMQLRCHEIGQSNEDLETFNVRAAKVEVDHLIRDNRYIIELPSFLHDYKTKYLDPFIRGLSLKDPSIVNNTSYWKVRRDNIPSNRSHHYRICGNRFGVGSHVHNERYEELFGGRLICKN